MRARIVGSILLLLSLEFVASAAAAMTAEEIAPVVRAAERGSAASQVLLAVAYLNGDGGLAKDPSAAARWFKAAALQGNADAEEKLGDLYAQGLGVERNPRLAADWCEKAANRGIVSAQLKLGKIYLDGRGVAKDSGKARYWIERAAIEGNAEAQFLLGKMYHVGSDIEANQGIARSWLEKAEHQGYESAVSLLRLIERIAYLLEEGWYHRLPELHKLAEDGDVEAQYQLAQRYEHGVDGLRKDRQAATLWYQRANSGGHPLAGKALKEMMAQPEHGN